jgi:hypothetical protein
LEAGFSVSLQKRRVCILKVSKKEHSGGRWFFACALGGGGAVGIKAIRTKPSCGSAPTQQSGGASASTGPSLPGFSWMHSAALEGSCLRGNHQRQGSVAASGSIQMREMHTSVSEGCSYFSWATEEQLKGVSQFLSPLL